MSAVNSATFSQVNPTTWDPFERNDVTAKGVAVVVKGAIYQNIYYPGTDDEVEGEFWYWFWSGRSADGKLRAHASDSARHTDIGAASDARDASIRSWLRVV